MKKIPILLAVSCFALAASAQQNDFFSIPEFLKKKSKENKQVSNPLVPSKPSLQNLLQPRAQLLIDQNRLPYMLPNGDKVYTLEQDNMPCVTPGVYRFDIQNGYRETTIASPFFFYNNLPGSIPNAAIRPKTFFSK